MAECTDYVEAKQLIDPNLEMVSPYPCLEAAESASSTEDSSSARTSSSEHDDRIIVLPGNPIKFANYPGQTYQKDIWENAYSYFKKLPESEFDEIVKNNVIDLMKSLHGSEQYWMRKFCKEEKDGKERAAKIEKQKNAKIEALEKKMAKLIAENITIESENKQRDSNVTYTQLHQENKYLKKQNEELEKKLKNENSYYDSLQIRYNNRKEDLKNVEKVCNELKELNVTMKAENEEHVLKINELEEELKNAQQSFFAKDDEIEKKELQHKKDMQNLEKQIQKLDKEKQLLQSEMQDYAEKEKTLNEKCSSLENEIVEYKRLNGDANDEIIKLQEQLQEMKKESESKTKISTEKEQSLNEKCSILENEKSESQKKFTETNQKNEKLIDELQLKMDKLEADKQSLIEKISAVESVENQKFEELYQKYVALETAETERSLTIANNEIINLKGKSNCAEMKEKLTALEEEKEKLKIKVFELETSADYYEKELLETRIRSNYNDLVFNEHQIYVTSRRITLENMQMEYKRRLASENFFKTQRITDSGPNTNAGNGPETIENVEQGQNVATVPGEDINGQLHDQAQNFEAYHSFLVFENNEFKNSHSRLKALIAASKTENEKLQKRLTTIEEYLKRHGNNPLPSIEKYQSIVEQFRKNFERLNAEFQDEKNSAISKSALLLQQNIQHSEEKKTWINIFNEFCVKINLLKDENVKLLGELKYYREAFSSDTGGNDEVVVPPKRKRKSLNPQQKEVQQPNITEKIPDSNNNDIQFSASENFASNNPGSSTQ